MHDQTRSQFKPFSLGMLSQAVVVCLQTSIQMAGLTASTFLSPKRTLFQETVSTVTGAEPSDVVIVDVRDVVVARKLRRYGRGCHVCVW